MRATTQAALQQITDCFTGADGGVQFARLRVTLHELDLQAVDGDQAAVGRGQYLPAWPAPTTHDTIPLDLCRREAR